MSRSGVIIVGRVRSSGGEARHRRSGERPVEGTGPGDATQRHFAGHRRVGRRAQPVPGGRARREQRLRSARHTATTVLATVGSPHHEGVVHERRMPGAAGAVDRGGRNRRTRTASRRRAARSSTSNPRRSKLRGRSRRRRRARIQTRQWFDAENRQGGREHRRTCGRSHNSPSTSAATQVVRRRTATTAFSVVAKSYGADSGGRRLIRRGLGPPISLTGRRALHLVDEDGRSCGAPCNRQGRRGSAPARPRASARRALGDLGDRSHALSVLASGTGTTRVSAIAGCVQHHLDLPGVHLLTTGVDALAAAAEEDDRPSRPRRAMSPSTENTRCRLHHRNALGLLRILVVAQRDVADAR